ncbi:MAG TPA: YitT family protein [Ruminiclostridium sp.]
MSKLKKVLALLKVYTFITIGAAITALAINVFLVPYKIAPGGLSGLATVLFYLSSGKLPVGTTMLAINIPLFILGYKLIGRSFFIRTLYGTIVLSAIIDITESYSVNFAKRLLINADSTASTPDILLYSIIGGFIMGIGVGIVLKMEATTGGTELIAKLLNKTFKGMTIGQLLLWTDAVVILFAIIAFDSMLIGLYSLVSLFVTIKVIDAMVEGIDYARAIFIISEYPDKISKEILTSLDRGVTELSGKGSYTGNSKNVLLCVVDRTQVQEVKKIVQSIDKNAFIIFADVREVLGEGFNGVAKK